MHAIALLSAEPRTGFHLPVVSARSRCSEMRTPAAGLPTLVSSMCVVMGDLRPAGMLDPNEILGTIALGIFFQFCDRPCVVLKQIIEQ